jgi:hypothetical protein
MSTKVMLQKARLAFPVLGEPEQFQGQGKPRYSGTFLVLPDSDNHKLSQAAMLAAAEAKWPGKGAAAVKSLTAGLKVAMLDGDTKSDYDGFEGMIYIGAHAQASAPPRLLDGQKRELPRDTGVIYAGCFVNAAVEFWAQDNQWGKRINCTLRGVQYAGEGQSFSASRPAEADEFDVVEEAVDAAGSDDFA